MLRATKTAPQNHRDRFSHALNFANELSKSTLRETKTRWTPEKRAEKGALIRLVRPWEGSTGPKTEAGKRNSSLNGGNQGPELRKFNRWLRLQRLYVRFVMAYRKPFPDDALMLKQRMLTLEQLLLKMRRELEAAKVETPALDARILMRQGGNFSDLELITEAACPLTPEVIEKTLKLLDRRLRGEPVSRILGGREFWGLDFKVTPATLDPRADTETLVAAALKRLREKGVKNPRILDLGTGTGCIPIALLKELPHATAVAVDISADALIVSRENAIRHGVENRLEFRQGSWFDVVNQGEAFHIITSNPPYIPESDIESLSREVRNHDPIQALSGGSDGLDAYKSILKDLKNHLECDGFALFEIGAGQEKDLARLIEDSNMNRSESYADLAGILRVVEITMGTSENIIDGPR